MRAWIWGFLLLTSCCVAADDRESGLKSLYDAHQWFKLRDAIAGAEAPLFYRAAVACVFNDPQSCEQLAGEFLKSAPPPELAAEAHDLLGDLYFRTGRFRLALSELEAEIEVHPSADAQNWRATYVALSQLPEQSIVERHESTIHVLYKDDFVPVTINGQSFKAFVDTGGGVSTIAESAAKRLGMAVLDAGGARLGDASGQGVNLKQVAVAGSLTIGNIRLKNVAFTVVSDRAQPFAGWNPGKRCVLGIQVLLACRTMRWKGAFPRAALQLGAPAGPKNLSSATLSMDGSTPVVAAECNGHKLTLVLDTGMGRTVLHAGFAKEFPQLVNGSGKSATRFFSGYGGGAKVQTMTLPRLTLRFGGYDTVFRHIDVYMKGPQSGWLDGVLGTDFLNKAREVTIDFESMMVSLR